MIPIINKCDNIFTVSSEIGRSESIYAACLIDIGDSVNRCSVNVFVSTSKYDSAAKPIFSGVVFIKVTLAFVEIETPLVSTLLSVNDIVLPDTFDFTATYFDAPLMCALSQVRLKSPSIPSFVLPFTTTPPSSVIFVFPSQ